MDVPLLVGTAGETNRGIAPPGYFERLYGDRDWRFYSYILAIAVTYSHPGPMLDVGAGAGHLVEAAHRWQFDCEGVEGSEDGLTLAAARGIKLRRHLLSEALPFTSGSFQTVFMNQVIGHLETPIARFCLREINRVLKPGGMVYIGGPSRSNRAVRQSDNTIINPLCPRELHDVLADSEFVDIRPFDKALPGRVRGIIFRRTRWSRLSATANAIAFKP